MANDIEIVIRGTDQFSTAFETLDAALSELSQQGESLDQTLEAISDSSASMAESFQITGEIAHGFSTDLAGDLSSLLATQQNTITSMMEAAQEGASAISATLLNEENQFLEQREARWNQSFQTVSLALSSHLAEMEGQLSASHETIQAMEETALTARLSRYQSFFKSLAELAASQGRASAGLAKTLAIAEALISAYLAANQALASAPYPLNIAAAALVLAQGLDNVQKIRQVNVAHGGLEFVPEESTYLLSRGERILTPGQNRELTHFLSDSSRQGAGQGVVIENLTIHILENATSGQSLLEMDADILRQILTEKIIPGLDALSRMGIQPESARS